MTKVIAILITIALGPSAAWAQFGPQEPMRFTCFGAHERWNISVDRNEVKGIPFGTYDFVQLSDDLIFFRDRHVPIEGTLSLLTGELTIVAHGQTLARYSLFCSRAK